MSRGRTCRGWNWWRWRRCQTNRPHHRPHGDQLRPDIPAHHAVPVRLLRRAPGDRASLRQPRRQAGAAVLRRHRPAQVSVQAPEPGLDGSQPAQGVLGVHAGAVEGVHLQRPQSRWHDHGRAGDLRAGADLVRIPAQRCPGRTEPHRGRRSDTGTHLHGQLHLPAIPLDRAVHRAAFRSPADRPPGPHPRARIRGPRHLCLRPARHGGRAAIPAAPDRHRRARLRRPDLAGHQRHLR